MKKILFHSGLHTIQTSLGLVFLRLATGGFMAFYHGWGKLSGYAEQVKDFPDPLGMGSQYSLIGTIGAEFVCAIMILIGLMTRWASIGLLFTMGVAAFIFHKSVVADIELPLIYFLSALCLIFTGAGKLSVDALIYKS